MKKIISICLLCVLMVSLAACGGKPSGQLPGSGLNSAGTSSAAGTSTQPEANQTPDSSNIPDSQKPDPQTPAVPQPAKGFTQPLDETALQDLAQVQDVTFTGLADSHSAEFRMADGSYTTLQFDPQRYLDLFQWLPEGSTIRIRVTEQQMGDTTVPYLAEYLGRVTPGVLMQVWDPRTYHAPAGLTVLRTDDDYPNYVLQFIMLDSVTDVNVWEVDMEEMIRVEKEHLIYRWDRMDANTQFVVEVEAPELTPELMVEFTLSNGEKQQYFASCDLSGMGPAVALVNAQDFMK